MSTSGGSGGGGALVPVTIGLNLNVDGNVATLLQVAEVQPLIVGNNELSALATSTPTVVAPLGNVCDSPSGAIGNVDTTSDSFFLGATIIVSNLAATEVLVISANVTLAIAGPNQSAEIDWTTADTTVVAGTDLAWDGTSVVSSTAGGVFVVSIALTATYE